MVFLGISALNKTSLRDKHLVQAVSKFICNKHRYLELNIFKDMEYTFEADMTMDMVPIQFVEMLNLFDHVPQVVVIVAGTNDLGHISKVQLRVRVEDIITDIC